MKNKKKAAAIAAVFAHIKTTEEAAAYQAMPVQEQLTEEIKESVVHSYENMNAWGFSGRSSQMQIRSMMQLRAFK